jgi:hypothetical protein
MKKPYFAAFAVLAFLSAGCSEINYEGKGNHFVIEGPITEIGDQSVRIKPTDPISLEGKSEHWFNTNNGGTNQIHNNYQDDGCSERHVDRESNEIQMKNLQVGEWIKVEGDIRESKDACGKHPAWSERPVFTSVQEIAR